jgi:hypothetical protein
MNTGPVSSDSSVPSVAILAVVAGAAVPGGAIPICQNPIHAAPAVTRPGGRTTSQSIRSAEGTEQ